MSLGWRQFILSLVLGLIIPAVVLLIGEKLYQGRSNEIMENQEYTENMDCEQISVAVLMQDGTVQDMEINDYLVSVLLREMPADFELEALKAQAVVARTYTLRRCTEGGRHEDADVCTDSSCCQAYWDVNKYLSDGGKMQCVDKMEKAVIETNNQVLNYKNSLIDATYFSCSGGLTEDAVAVWGNEVPYLRSVESPGEEDAKHYVDTVTFSKEEFIEKLAITKETNRFTIEDICYTTGGGVDTVKICGVPVKGTTLRSKLKLNSTAMLISIVGDSVTITTKGKGHRVGMSQYGANAMAKDGADYLEILSHYYYQTDLVLYEPN